METKKMSSCLVTVKTVGRREYGVTANAYGDPFLRMKI